MKKSDIGLIGLAVMGENLVMNMESRGFTVSVYNRTSQKVTDFVNGRAKGKNIRGTYSLAELVSTLRKPRRVMLMIKAGKPVDDMIEQLIENDTMASKINMVRDEIKEHSSMPEALEKAQVFSNLYSRMVAVAFRSGSVDTVMQQIALSYESATDKQLRRIVSIIEPTIVIILSLIVGIILLSVLLPLMGIMSSIG